jgi:D-alanine-D-alanine ligase
MTIHVHPDWWKTMFDDVYLLTDARSVCDEELTRREVDVICEILPIENGQKILDLCGGHGRHSFELVERGFTECTLVDYSRPLIDRAMRFAEERDCAVNAIRSDARDTGLPPETFDHVIIMGNSLGYIAEPIADGQILEEAYRLLRSGGWILIDVTDGAAVRGEFTSGAWHEVGGDVVVCREREIIGDKVQAREMVLSKKNGLIRDRTYAVRLYDSQGISDLLYRAAFENISVLTDFSPHRYKGDYGFMNRRMIATGQKN